MQIGLEETQQVLQGLLCGRDGEGRGDRLPGAELVVYDGGEEVFRAALARHSRRDGSTFWVRPIGAMETDPDTGLPSFDLQVNRRRALDVAAARSEGQRLELALATGQTAVVQPAAEARLNALAAFDSWLITLPAQVVAGIERLESDSEAVEFRDESR